MTTTWSIRIDTLLDRETLDYYETTAATRPEAIRALYAAAVTAAGNVATQAVPEQVRYTLDVDHGFHAVVLTGTTDTGRADHAGARAALTALRERYCITN